MPPKVRLAIALGALAVLLALGAALGSSGSSKPSLARLRAAALPVVATGHANEAPNPTRAGSMLVGHSSRNDLSQPLRRIRPVPFRPHAEREPSANLRTALRHQDAPDGARQTRVFAPRMPSTTLNFDGIAYPGVNCSCFPPDTNGEVGATQYVQIVNQGIQVFDKTTGASLLGPVDIATIWSGLGGACELGGAGDPVVLYDQLANRWVVSQFATATGDVPITDECIAVSTSSDATGTYNRYDFHLGSNFFDYPKLSVWPDGYYMSMNVFNAAGTAFLGPQPFAFNRAAMLAGAPASFISPGVTNGPSEDPYLPADVDGPNPPPAGAPDPFVGFPGSGAYKVYRFHVDWAAPGSSTFALAGAPAAAAFTSLCPTTANCVPQLGTAAGLDGLADRLMFRAAYRNFGDHDSLVANFTVKSNNVAGIRWFELRNVTSGTPTLAQQSTYQPDTTWRWLGSAAMDGLGDLALGYSASSSTINPQIRYAGRLAGDPPNTLAQGEAHLFDGTGSQTDNHAFRWGDYSDLTVDPVDDCTFWYTQEYYPANASRSWSTRIGDFRFPSCAVNRVSVARAGSGSGVITSVPGGVNCGPTCLFQYAHGTTVTLIAAADPGSVFTGWSGGGCSGTVSCTVTLNADTAVTATFTAVRTLTVTKTGTGSGTVTSTPAGIACGATCTKQFTAGTSVTLKSAAAAGSKFTGWSGDCSGTGSCSLTMSVNNAVTARFAKVLTCKVPRLTGLTLKKARARLAKAHCRLGKVRKKASRPRKRGRVLSQKPRPGKQLPNGARVNVIVGNGPRR